MRCGALVALAGVLLQAVGCLPNETVVDLQMFAADFLRRIAAAALF